jgi:AcrR family transcriptional regulator
VFGRRDPQETMPQRTTPARATPAAARPAIPDLRQQTLDVARRLIGERGYREVSMRDIAGEVGCSVSSLYLHFDSRDALIHTLIDEGYERWYGEMLAVAEREPEPWARLEAIARRYVEFGVAEPELYEIMYMFNPRSMERLPRELFRRIRAYFHPWSETVKACGVKGDQSVVVATAVWTSLHGAVSTLLTQRLDTRIDRERYIEAVLASAVASVRAATTG